MSPTTVAMIDRTIENLRYVRLPMLIKREAAHLEHARNRAPSEHGCVRAAVDSIRGTSIYRTDPSDQTLFSHFILLRMKQNEVANFIQRYVIVHSTFVNHSTLCDKFSQFYSQISGYIFIWTTLCAGYC